MTELQIAERLVETAREPMAVLDAELRVVAASPRWTFPPALLSALSGVTGHDERVTWEGRTLLVNVTPLDGGFLVAIEDLTERESLLNQAAHDLRSPLATSTNFLQLILRDAKGRLNDEDLQRLDRALANLRRLQTLIRDGVEFLSHETASPHLEIVNLEIPLRVALEKLDAQAEIGPLPDVNTDSKQMALVFEHLIANSIRFRRADPLRISVRSTKEGAEHHVTVCDNGQGFDPRHAEEIFAPLKRLQSPDVAGSGLGLALSRRTIEGLGGRITAEGRRGEGATFHIYLPAS